MEFLNNHQSEEDDGIQVLPEVNVWSVIRKIVDGGEQDDSFYICDVPDLIRKYTIWKATMPRVTTHYGKQYKASNRLNLSIRFTCTVISGQ